MLGDATPLGACSRLGESEDPLSKALALVLNHFGEELRDKEYPLPDPAPGELVVALEVSGVCGSDVHQWLGQDPRVPLPLILGHEGVGRVARVGEPAFDVNGQRIAEGDRVTFNRGVSCMRCRVCVVHRRPALCPHRWVYGITRSCRQPPHLFGCYATHVFLGVGVHTVVLPEELAPEVAAAAACSGATCASCFDEVRPRAGDRVVIQGPGPIGAFAVAFARASGAEAIIVVGGTRSRLAVCEQLGATAAINRRETTPAERTDAILELTYGEGADVVYEASGDQHAIAEGLKWLRPGGAYVSCGMAEPRGGLELDFFHDIARKHIRLQGIWVNDTRHLLQALSIAEANQDVLATMIDGRFPLYEATTALRAVADRSVMKAVLVQATRAEGAR